MDAKIISIDLRAVQGGEWLKPAVRAHVKIEVWDETVPNDGGPGMPVSINISLPADMAASPLTNLNETAATAVPQFLRQLAEALSEGG